MGGPSTRSHPPVLTTPTSSAPSTESEEDSVNPLLSEGEREGLLGSEESEDEDTAVPEKRKYLPRDSTVKFLNSVTENTLRNDCRRKLLEKFPILSCDPAHPPKVHAALMGIIPKPAKRHDRHLSKMQQFAMDAPGPLTWLYEQLETAETVDRARAKLAVQSTLSLLGNSTAHFSLERRKAIMKHLNEEISPLVEEKFPNRGPYLFGEDFGQKAKTAANNMRALKGSQGKRTKPFFQESGNFTKKRKVFQPQSRRGAWGISGPTYSQTSVLSRLGPPRLRQLQQKADGRARPKK